MQIQKIDNLDLTYSHRGVEKLFDIQKNPAKPNFIKIHAYWMSAFESKNKICNLSLDLGDRLYLAFTKKIWMLYQHQNLVTHC